MRKEPHVEAGRAVARHCLADGLLVSVRRSGSVLRFVPPFYTTDAPLDRAADVLDRALARALDEQARAR